MWVIRLRKMLKSSYDYINKDILKYWCSKNIVGGLPTKKLLIWVNGEYVIWDTDGMVTTYNRKY